MDTRNITSIEHDIYERKEIIDRFMTLRILNRQDAIEKIESLRLTDTRVAEVTGVKLLFSRTPFEKCTDEQIVAELQMQIEVLYGELAEIVSK